MYGNLFLYDDDRKLVAFQSGPFISSKYVIFLGGLTDGFLTVPYLERLASELEKSSLKYSFIQPLFRSSYLQYGWHTIDDDVEDLERLLNYLAKRNGNLQSIVLMGHSTGCQDIIHYLRHRKEPFLPITQVILQGPVSDREYLAQFDSTKEQMKYCEEHQNDKQEWLPRSLHYPPISIERCRSLNERNSIEDLFSTDLTDEELDRIYGNISVPITWICSKEDEYIPVDLRQKVIHLIQNRLAHKTHSTCLLLETADHAISQSSEQEILIEHVLKLIASLKH